MDLSWELEQLGRAAEPNVVLEGRRLLHRVSDLLHHDDGSVEALVRGEEPQVVTLQGRYPLDDSSCSCGRTRPRTPCAHAIAVRLRALQLFHGFDDGRIERWERRVEALQALRTAWDALASVWLESVACHDDDAAAAVILRDAGSLDGCLQIAHALDGRATREQLSAFLVEVAEAHGIDGRTSLGRTAVIKAYELASWMVNPSVFEEPGVCTDALLAVAGSSRRTVTRPAADWKLEAALAFSCGVLGQLVADGHADAANVADALMQAECAAPASQHPWSAIMFDDLGRGAKPVALEMSALLDQRDADPGAAVTEEPQFHLRAEIGFASEGVPGLVPILEEWQDAPYGEFLCRLPRTFAPMPRVQLLESAHRSGRARWAPGWPQHHPRPGPPQSMRSIRDVAPSHPMWRDVALGDLVVAEVQLGRLTEARDILREHALRDADPSHRYEFLRIWAAAKLGPGAEECAAGLFGPAPASDDLGELLSAISHIPEPYFTCDLSDARRGIGTALLTAILFEDIPAEGHARTLDAPVWATSFLASHPEAADDLGALASLPSNDVAQWLEGAVLDEHLALRVLKVAAQFLEGGCPVRSMADLRYVGEGEFIDALDHAADAKPLTAALVSLVLGDDRHPELENVQRRFLRRALSVDPPQEGAALLERAYLAEPRGADVGAYQLGVVLAERDGRTAQGDRRRQL